MFLTRVRGLLTSPIISNILKSYRVQDLGLAQIGLIYFSLVGFPFLLLLTSYPDWLVYDLLEQPAVTIGRIDQDSHSSHIDAAQLVQMARTQSQLEMKSKRRSDKIWLNQTAVDQSFGVALPYSTISFSFARQQQSSK